MSTPNMGLTLPVDHGSSDQWDLILDTVFGLIDSHDHSPGKGVKVPMNALNVNADLSFSPSGTPRAILDLKAIDFAPVASTAVTLLAGAFFISDGTGGLVANELYFRTTSGSNVRFTLGAALNVAAFAGGIGGDYSAVSALLDYDDATDTYRLRQETSAAVRQFAKLSCADLRLTEYKASGVTPVPPAAVTIKSPAALAGSYSVTMPAALPGSTQLVQMDSSGVLTASNTVANALTMPGTMAGATNFSGAITMASTLGVTGILTASTSVSTPTITNTPNFTGAVTMASTLGVTGLITASNGLTAAVNKNVTVSGTGDIKHGSRTLNIASPAFVPSAASSQSVLEPIACTVPARNFSYAWRFGTNGDLEAHVPLRAGDRITAITGTIAAPNNTANYTMTLVTDQVDGSATTTVISSFSPGVGTSVQISGIFTTSGLPYTLTSLDAIYVRVQCTDTNSNLGTHLIAVSVVYDHP